MQLVDKLNRPLRDLRISVTDRCNFRCTYCMPEEIFGERYQFLPKPQILTFEEITRLARLFVAQGVVKLRITGGEPLMRHELEKLIAQLHAIEGVEDIALTTNAYFLPTKAQALKEAGLERITVSLDSLDDAVFRSMNGNRAGVDQVLAGIRAADEAGFAPIKINSVVKRGVNDHTIVEIARWAKDHNYIMRFIEYMDVGTRNGWNMQDVVTAREIVERIDAELPLEPIDHNYQGEVAERYRFKDGGGEIGVIASVTRPFCGTCTRLRLSPEGKIFTCLFGIDGFDLRDPMRAGATDEELTAMLQSVWRNRTDRYSEIRTELTEAQKDERKKVEMYHIGG